MCGIAGFVGGAPPELLPAMLRALKHRGPDDEGTQLEPGLGLGVTRLAIIDLVTGHQPVTTADGEITVVFNGEIYNFRELRRTLEAAGHQFRTRTDTEVIPHAYRAWGQACVERFRGMFAFALWDRRRRRLMLGRDRLGKKPLYYWQAGDTFLFASELKALLCHAGLGRRLDLEAFHHYLAFGYPPGDRAILDGVGKLPPGHTALLEDGRLTLARYWSLPRGAPPLPARAAEAAARVRETVREAVRVRLESDVPLGVFLSGGIDSSAVVAAMREVTSGRIATFTIGFGAETFDERPYARLVAERFATDHHEEVVEPSVSALLPAVVHHLDEPLADASAVPTFVLAQATARRAKVVLSGLGGDEAFAGYPRHLGLKLSTSWARMPAPLRRPLGRAALGILPESETTSGWTTRLRRFLAEAETPLPDRYIAWTRFFTERDLASLATPALRQRWRAGVDARHRAAFADGRDALAGAFRIDLATYLGDDLLVLGDRMSMAHGLELRAPFCDHRVIEESLGLPAPVKLPGLRLKGLLKTAFADVLPPTILERPKHGFMIPLARWLRTDLKPLVDDLLAPARVRARGLFEPAAVDTLRREHQAGAHDHADRLWTLLIAELWMQQVLDGGGREPGGAWSLG